MRYFTRFLINLAVLVFILLVIYMLYPDVMRQVIQLYGLLLGPVAILLLLVMAIPNRRKR